MMAYITMRIQRDNGVDIQASSTVDDSVVAEMSMMLSAMMFDAATQPPTEGSISDSSAKAPAPVVPSE